MYPFKVHIKVAIMLLTTGVYNFIVLVCTYLSSFDKLSF